MKRKKFSQALKKSIQPRKQRRYNYTAPLHVKQKLVSVHLSKELKKKYNRRSIGIRKGDRVKILRGQFKGSSGSVESVDLKKGKVLISGAENIKKDGAKVPYPITTSNLMITELYMDDKKRNIALKRTLKSTQSEVKTND